MQEVLEVTGRTAEGVRRHLEELISFCDLMDLSRSVDTALSHLLDEGVVDEATLKALASLLMSLQATGKTRNLDPLFKKLVLLQVSYLGGRPSNPTPPAITNMVCRASSCEECSEVRSFFGPHNLETTLELDGIGAAAVKHIQRQLEANGGHNLATWEVNDFDTKRGLTVRQLILLRYTFKVDSYIHSPQIEKKDTPWLSWMDRRWCLRDIMTRFTEEESDLEVILGKETCKMLRKTLGHRELRLPDDDSDDESD